MVDLQTAYQRLLLCEQAGSAAAKPVAHEYVAIKKIADGETAIAFPGTDVHSFMSLLTDAEAWPVRSDLWPGHVHAGFADSIRDCWPELLKILPPTPQTLHLTGHSQGADLAIGGAWLLAGEGYTIGSLYLFAPAVFGDSNFCHAFNARGWPTVRFVNHNDLVPSLPPWWSDNVGELVYFDASGQLQATFTDRSVWRLTLEDHHLAEYLRVIGNAINEGANHGISAHASADPLHPGRNRCDAVCGLAVQLPEEARA